MPGDRVDADLTSRPAASARCPRRTMCRASAHERRGARHSTMVPTASSSSFYVTPEATIAGQPTRPLRVSGGCAARTHRSDDLARGRTCTWRRAATPNPRATGRREASRRLPQRLPRSIRPASRRGTRTVGDHRARCGVGRAAPGRATPSSSGSLRGLDADGRQRDYGASLLDVGGALRISGKDPPEPPARRAWREWRRRVGVDDAGHGRGAESRGGEGRREPVHEGRREHGQAAPAGATPAAASM